MITQVITGLSGIGKSQLACHFAYKYRQAFPGGVFWLDFVDRKTAFNSFVECGYGNWLNLYGNESTLQSEQKAIKVKRCFEQDEKRLLIFGNCEDPKLVQHWRPRQGGASILITSCFKDWRALNINTVALGPLPRKDSIALLQTYRVDLSTVHGDLDQIANHVGDLPLALHLAGSFMHAHENVGANEYLLALQRENLDFIDESVDGGVFHTHDRGVLASINLSYKRLRGDDPRDRQGLRLMHVLACFAPGDPIPTALLVECFNGEYRPWTTKLLAHYYCC